MRRFLFVTGLILAATGVTTAAEVRPAPTPTYTRDVAPILQKHCQDCHRPGQVAPFSLLTFEQARKRASDLAAVTGKKSMPPWPASTTEGGPFRDARVMSEAEVATIAAWYEAGCPQGDPKDAPPERSWNSEWPMGEPDLVLTMPEPYNLPADGKDEHRVFVVPTGLKEDRWVSAIDFKPGNPRVVHHILAAYDTLGRARKLDREDDKPGYGVFGGFGILPSGGIGGWAPGKRPQALPEGVGRYLPAGADVLLQVHYHKSGKPETDATRIALYFSKTPVDKQVRGQAVLPPRPGLLSRPTLLIPAGEGDYEVKGTITLARDSHVTAVAPHMHWLGKDFLLRARKPDGSAVTLIRIDQWNFNWQGTYDFEKHVALPKGTKVEMLAHFDNSAANPSNPSKPPVAVRWGEETTDEMCIGFLQMTHDDEHLGNKPPSRTVNFPFRSPEPSKP
ncbi:MAG: ascorbate-dependent monooxygenase [Isosphaeraceae bacterium]